MVERWEDNVAGLALAQSEDSAEGLEKWTAAGGNVDNIDVRTRVVKVQGGATYKHRGRSLDISKSSGTYPCHRYHIEIVPLSWARIWCVCSSCLKNTKLAKHSRGQDFRGVTGIIEVVDGGDTLGGRIRTSKN